MVRRGKRGCLSASMRSDDMVNEQLVEFRVRNARMSDLREIWTLVGTCGPYLTQHDPYVYMKDLRCFSDTLAVALMKDRIVGWCSMFPKPDGVYFLHQIGASPDARGKGIAEALLTFQLDMLGERHGRGYRVELTMNRTNLRAQKLFRKVVADRGMRLEKSPEIIRLLEEDCDEELYILTPCHRSVSVEVPDSQISIPQAEVLHALQY